MQNNPPKSKQVTIQLELPCLQMGFMLKPEAFYLDAKRNPSSKICIFFVKAIDHTILNSDTFNQPII